MSENQNISFFLKELHGLKYERLSEYFAGVHYAGMHDTFTIFRKLSGDVLIKSTDFYNPKTNKLTRKKKSRGHVLKLLMLPVGLTQSE